MDINKINTMAMAYLGDAVYEVYVRRHVLEENGVDVNRQNKVAVKFVRAEGQAYALKKMMESLSEEEQRLAKRARNRKITSKPQHADPVTYKLATAFEALIGYLYLQGQAERMEEVIHTAMEIIEKADIQNVREKAHK